MMNLKASLNDDDAICCSLSVFGIAEAPPYTALSYTWGPSTSAYLLYVDDKTFQVRKNLFRFLQVQCPEGELTLGSIPLD